jgi:hypothetical protein
MRRSFFVASAVVVTWLCATTALAQSADRPALEVGVNAPGAGPEYPVVKRGQIVMVNAQRFVVAREPLPVASVGEAPPAPRVVEDEASRPPAPSENAIWVAGHWAHGADGFVWISGRYVAARAGHAFVPPRWAVDETRHLFFTGFYVPYGVYVRSHFNRYYFSGVQRNAAHPGRSPYWPIGAPGPAKRPLTSASTRRDPYWPIGARR